MKAIWKNLLWVLLIITGCAGAGTTIYFVYENNKNNQSYQDQLTQILANDDVNNNLKQFSQQNSFKINLQSDSPTYNDSSTSYKISQGTAWSWYYENNPQTGNFIWYLMTNFHVLNEPINYICKIQNQQYHQMVTIQNFYNYFFNLEKWDVHIGKYNELLNSIDNEKNWNIKQISLITDNNIANFDLFSNDYQNYSDHYNLDMGLIKIVFNNKPAFFNNLKIVNNVNNYESNHHDFHNNYKYYYFAGNPGSFNQLVYQLLLIEQMRLERFTFNSEKEPQIRQLIENVYISKEFISNWQLTAGASGSCVYLVNNVQNEDLFTKPAIGIYWGGRSLEKVQYFQPSFIPFITDFNHIKYNIYDNFKILHKNKII